MATQERINKVGKLLQNARTFATRDTKSIRELLNLLTGKPNNTNWPNNICLAFYKAVIQEFAMDDSDCEYLLAISGLTGEYKQYKKAEDRRNHYRKVIDADPDDEITNSGMKQQENRMLLVIARELVFALEQSRYGIDEKTGKIAKKEESIDSDERQDNGYMGKANDSATNSVNDKCNDLQKANDFSIGIHLPDLGEKSEATEPDKVHTLNQAEVSSEMQSLPEKPVRGRTSQRRVVKLPLKAISAAHKRYFMENYRIVNQQDKVIIRKKK